MSTASLRRDGLLAGAGAAQRAQQRAVVGAHWRADIGLDAELARGLGVRPAARDIAGAGAPLIERALAQRVGPGHVHAFGDLHAAFIARIAHVLDAGLQVDRGQVGGLQPGDGPEHVQQRARQLLDALGVGQGRRQFREYPVHGGSFARGWGGTAIARARGPAMRDYARPARAARRFQASERPNSASIQSRSAPRRRLGAGFGIGQMIGMVAARRHAHVEQLDQPALGQFARDQLPLHQADRAAVHDCLRHMAGFREGDAAAVVEIRHAGGGHPQRPVGPDHAAGPAIHVAQRMRGQVARLARRRAGFEQARAANRHHHRAEQPVRHDAGIAARAISDGRVQVMGVGRAAHR